VSPCECKTRDANHSTVDSLVFGRNHHRVMPSNGLLWKKNFTWVKPTQRHHFALFFTLTECNFFSAREIKIDFVVCPRTSIS
jgi:hypothetical protein